MSHPSSRITLLASIIASQTAIIDNHLSSNNLPQPSFEPDGPIEPIQKSTAEIEKARKDVIEATTELKQLLEGPVNCMLGQSNLAPIAIVHRHRIPSHVPIDQSISYKDLAISTALKESDLRRICRYTAVYHRVFQETTPGFVSHTAASKLLAMNGLDGRIHDLMGLTYDECWPAHARTPDAVRYASDEPSMSGYALANETQGKTMFEYLESHPDRAKAFAGAMGGASLAGLRALAEDFNWQTLPTNSMVVDVGGSQGHVSVHLAREFPSLKFTVQDLPTIIEAAKAEAKIPEDVGGRVDLVGHDMFTPQPSAHEQKRDGPDIKVFLLRYVLHDWPDKYCVKILQNLIPALTKGTKVVLQEHILPNPGTLGLLDEMRIRSMDAIMLSLFNSREREEQDWIQLFGQADERFVNFSATRGKENPNTAVIVVEWAG